MFAEGEAARIASDAGADFVVDDEMLERIQGGWTDWEVSLATPDQMPKVGRLGRVLGPRGLMPNPRNNTVVQPNQIESAINAARQGRQEIRMDRHANLHARIGRRSFTDEQLLNNLAAVYDTITRAKPEGVKGPFIKTATLCSADGSRRQSKLAKFGYSRRFRLELNLVTLETKQRRSPDPTPNF